MAPALPAAIRLELAGAAGPPRPPNPCASDRRSRLERAMTGCRGRGILEELLLDEILEVARGAELLGPPLRPRPERPPLPTCKTALSP